MLKAAHLTKKDIILEIGAGTGNLTSKLAEKAKKVIAIENDSRFQPVLLQSQGNVEVIIGNALKILPQRKDFNKIVASIPYQICEPLMHYLCTAQHLKLAVLLVPKKFALNLLKHLLFSAFLQVTLVTEVAKESFNPPPKVQSEIILIKLRQKVDDDLFIRQKLYRQRHKKVKNGLRDAIIDLYWNKHQQRLSKKEALIIVDSFKLAPELLATSIARMHPKWYEIIGDKVKSRKD